MIRYIFLCLAAIFISQITLLAQNDDVTNVYQIGSNSYRLHNNNWYALTQGAIGDKVEITSLIIKVPNNDTISNEILETYGVTRKADLVAGYTVVEVSSNAAFETADDLYADGFYVEFDHEISFSTNPNDMYFLPTSTFWGQWGHIRTGVPTAWNTTKGSSDVLVAISDTGVDYQHEDLQKNKWANPLEIPNNNIDDDFNGYVDDVIGWDFYNEDNDPNAVCADGDYICAHGTNVAGIIHATANNNKGIAGIAGGWGTQKGATMMPLRIDNLESQGLSSVIYAVQNGAKVVNMSWGGTSYSQVMQDVFDYLSNNYNAIFICAAGNVHGQINYPAKLNTTISVGSANNNELNPNTASGNELTLAAPYGVLTTDPMGTGGNHGSSFTFYWDFIHGVYSENYMPYFIGTSSSAPYVSGAVALMLSVNPGLSAAQTKTILQNTAEKIGGYSYPGGYSTEMGYGLLKVDTAVSQALSTPTATLISPNGGLIFYTGDVISIQWQKRNYAGTVRLELYNENGFVQTISTAASGTSFNWAIPTNLPSNRTYRIKVKGSSVMVDYSDRAFSIIKTITIPDTNFRNTLISLGVDANADGRIDAFEAEEVTNLNVSGQLIYAITGIEYFTNLKDFDCSNNKLSSIRPILDNTNFTQHCNRIDVSDNSISTNISEVCELLSGTWNFIDVSGQNVAIPCSTTYFPCTK